MYCAQHVSQILTKCTVSLQIFVKVPHIKLHENQSSGSGADDACGQTDRQTDERTDMTKEICVFRDLCERA
jgi:hypothetical protein